jgi:hypothetical protein
MLSIRFLLADLSDDAPVVVKESRGKVKYLLHKGLFLPEGVAALNASSSAILAGGQWFQLWQGEIISINSPEPKARSIEYAGVHRGPLVDQAAGPRNR